jgi:hypothetical protein
MDGDENFNWPRLLGGGCLVNFAVTCLLVALVAGFWSFSIDTIAVPFLLAATVSFGGILYFLRDRESAVPPMRKLILSGAGVLLGSISAVIGIAAFLLLSGGLN